ncbi:MAG: peptide chain release factor N(5)-glutamine methyltransferase [bacterium]
MQIKDLKKEVALPSLEFDLITAHVIHKTREFVLAHGEFKLSNKEEYKIYDLAERRLAGEPLAYLFGYQEFFGLNFLVSQHTLIPRPETELIIDESLQILKSKASNEQITILDVGTGSGCIAISLAHKLGQDSRPVSYKIIAIDIENKALKLARKNAKLNNVKDLIIFKEGNLIEPLLDMDIDLQNSSFLICANLPYLTPKQFKNSPTIQHEPVSALISGEDGLQHYRELFKQLKHWQIKNSTLLCEIDDTQGQIMTELIKKELPGRQFIIKKDLGGYDRLAIITT